MVSSRWHHALRLASPHVLTWYFKWDLFLGIWPKRESLRVMPLTGEHWQNFPFSWVPSPYCSPPGCPFPVKSLALSAHVSPQTIHFQVLDKSPVLGHGRGPPSCNTKIHILVWEGTNLSLWHCQCHFYLAEYCYFWVQVGHPEMCWTFLL